MKLYGSRVNFLIWATALTVLLLGFSNPADAQRGEGSADMSTGAAVQRGGGSGGGDMATGRQPEGGPISHPQIVSIAYDTWFINEFGEDSQYLLIGTKRALLIDTGWGLYDIKALVESLTDLPYDVVTTHSHHDHAGMIGNFDTVYMYPKPEVQKDPSKTVQRPKREGAGVPDSCRYIWDYSTTEAKWAVDSSKTTIKPLYDGQTFDLGGGRIVTVYFTPGHTADSCVFLDHKTRILFSGDMVLPKIPIHGVSPTAASTRLRSWIKAQSLGAEYDRIFFGHTSRGCEVDVKPLDRTILDNCIELYRMVLSGDEKYKKIENPESPGRYTAIWKNAQVDVELDNLWEPGEKHIVP